MCLTEAPYFPMNTYPIHCICVYSILIHTERGGGGGELTREKVRGAMLHKAGAGRKDQHD
jgi:hypothetical protein